jgi:hypothetical protein
MGIADELGRLRQMSDDALLAGLSGALRSSRGWTALVLAHLAEVEDRRLHLLAGCSSMFVYCTVRLGMSEDEACRRIAVARLARQFPLLYDELASGTVSLSVAALLEHHLTADNHAALIAAVSGKTVREAREALAAWFPRPDVPAAIRKLPERRTPASAAGPLKDVTTPAAPTTPFEPAISATPSATANTTLRLAAIAGQSGTAISSASAKTGVSTIETTSQDAVAAAPQPVLSGAQALTSPRGMRRRASGVEPLSPGRYKIVFTADTDLKRTLELVTDLLRHAVPSGDLATIIHRALDLLLEETLRRRFAKTKHSHGRACATPSATPGSAAEPASQPAEPTRQTAEPARQTAAPALEPMEPALEPIEPARQAAAPALEPMEPALEPMEPALEPMEPARQTAAPARQTAAPALEPMEPALEPMEPARQAAPARQTAAPALEPMEPALEPMEPAHQTAAPAREPAAPARQRAEPAHGPMDPAHEPMEPAHQRADSTPPGDEATTDGASDAGPVDSPPRSPQHLPSAVRRAVLERDGLRCTWQGPDGVRCEGRAWLEHDHIHPRGQGGLHDAANIHLYCRAHNQLSAEQTYGKAKLARIIARRRTERRAGAHDATDSARLRPSVRVASRP